MTKARTLADNFAADINGITASAPLTGGGTSGTVTVGIQAGTTAQSGAVQLTDSTASTSTTTAATPNSVKSAYDLANGAIAKSTVDAKGDLLVGTANDTIGRLAVASTAGYLLTVDSAQTTGLKWAAPSGGDWVKITTPGANSGATEISNTSFTSTYNVYCLIFRRLRLSGTADLQFRFRDSGEITTSNYNGNTFGYTNGNALRTNGMNNTSFIDLGVYDTGNSSGYLYIITNQNDVNVVPSVIGQMYSTETNTAFSIGAAFNGSPNTIEGFRLYLSTGTFNDTRCDLYGLK